MQIVDEDADPALQRRRGADHAFGLVEHDPRLVPAGRGGVDLGALLTVGDQQVEADPGRERALAVLPWHRAVGGAEASETVGALPAEQAADDERLPGREREGLPGPLALGVTKKAKELDRMARGTGVEAESTARGRGQVGEMTLAGEADETIAEDLATGHSARVGGDGLVSGRPSHGPAGKPRTGLRAP